MTAIRELLVTFVGLGQVWITARIDIDDNLSGAQVKSLIRNLESDLKHEPEGIYRVDIVPVENDGPSTKTDTGSHRTSPSSTASKPENPAPLSQAAV